MGVITYKLKPFKSLSGKKHFILMVNDMTIEGKKTRGNYLNKSYGWQVNIYHDNKIVEQKFYRKPSETVDYLNAYIEVARTPVNWLVT
jgi:hypothetical protein